LLAIARVLRAKPEMAIDRTKAAGEYCFKSSESTMVHYASQPESTVEDVVYEFDATQLLAAGLDPQRVPRLPALGKMEPGKWYLLPSRSGVLATFPSASLASQGLGSGQKTKASKTAPTYLDLDPDSPASLDTLKVSVPPAVKLAAAERAASGRSRCYHRRN